MLLELVELCCCWENVLSFTDIPTAGVLATCSTKLRDAISYFWLLQCDAIYPRDHPRRQHNTSCPILAKELIRQMVDLKSFSEYSAQLLEANRSYRYTRWHSTETSPVTLLPVNELFLEMLSYDFLVTIRYANGFQTLQKLYPARSTLCLYRHDEICFMLPPTITWPGLQRVQEYYDKRDFRMVRSDDSGTDCLRSAWDSTSVLVVARKMSSANRRNRRPYVVAAASSFAENQPPQPLFLDFANHDPGTTRDLSLPTCTQDFDRYWTFLDSTWKVEPIESEVDVEIGLVARNTSLVWLVLRLIS